ncbi:deoxyribodipyrimidine photolyase-related protein [Cnuella takakiae]|uniref:Deoxyribodipyrimidine photolyase-related protein n=1 Tax=Cnuella takakiae TaxID=1302690 RepID=A0A1M5B2U4_9BACT|nr:cryptochrome/photolyase family protein [Cnuella takakiae]OLY93315.1 cryptochrome/photolyase family protein [Cnuella takakiae]SHF36881.1 deoxyribodipyrimidine photolyase-related protein [Cnuella takakiae]
MTEVSLVFPHQLFRQHPALAKDRTVYLVEEPLFFTQFAFHQQKLVLHRASMQFYRQWLQQQGFTVHYIACKAANADIRVLVKELANEGVTAFHLCELADDWLTRRLQKAAGSNSLVWHRSPAFLNSATEGSLLFPKGKYFQTDFYKAQRQQRNLLLDDGKPLGGRWTFDDENRLKLPKEVPVPQMPLPTANQWVDEALNYVQQNFSKHYGSTQAPFTEGRTERFYPTTFEEADEWLGHFLEQRFALFGPYEDALSQRHPVMFHSLLSPLLNTGLLTPQQVLNAVLEHASQHEIPMNSLEGFIRQLVGWREYIRQVYELEGRKQRTRNYWGFNRSIPASFYNGTTGIAPIDAVIKKVLQTGYAHHIERLMVLGNFFLLCEFHPDEVYRWFMELFIDSYDWVMVPNTYGMTQFADGGLMMTKPYISGSNYLMKMGEFTKGPWQEVWDGLFWRFMHVQRNFFLQNPRLGMLVRTFDKMPEAKRLAHLKVANEFLKKIDRKEVVQEAPLLF